MASQAYEERAARFVPDPALEEYFKRQAGRWKFDRRCRVVLTIEQSRRHWTEVHPIRRG
jgi:hypothetical protein